MNPVGRTEVCEAHCHYLFNKQYLSSLGRIINVFLWVLDKLLLIFFLDN